MSYFNERDLRETFRKRLKLHTVGLPSANLLSWENRGFDPPSSTEVVPWLREEAVVILNERRSTTGFIETTGVIIFWVMAPKGKGTEAAETLASSIASAFEPTLFLTDTSSDTTIVVERCERQPLGVWEKDPVWCFKPIIIRWRVFSPVSLN